MRVIIQFKNPDAIHDIINAKHPMPADQDDITPRMEREAKAFADQYFGLSGLTC